jgi:hypothetical protein
MQLMIRSALQKSLKASLVTNLQVAANQAPLWLAVFANQMQQDFTANINQNIDQNTANINQNINQNIANINLANGSQGKPSATASQCSCRRLKRRLSPTPQCS